MREPVNHTIQYPYIPDNEEVRISYVDSANEFMQLAIDYARKKSLDRAMPNSSVIVKDGKVLGIGANGSRYHDTNVCERVRLNIPTGQGYDLCEGCHPRNHGEQQAIRSALKEFSSKELKDSDIYLWGHWWLCESCWDKLLEHEIRSVYLLEGSEELFNRDHPNNIIGKQFEVQ